MESEIAILVQKASINAIEKGKAAKREPKNAH